MNMNRASSKDLMFIIKGMLHASHKNVSGRMSQREMMARQRVNETLVRLETSFDALEKSNVFKKYFAVKRIKLKPISKKQNDA